jgi:hypothetical protein
MLSPTHAIFAAAAGRAAPSATASTHAPRAKRGIPSRRSITPF